MAVNTTIQVTLPAMGETVEADETLVEVSTDKVDAEVPAPTSGTVVKIHAAEGDTVQVGAVLAEIASGDGASGGRGPRAATGRARPLRPPCPTTRTFHRWPAGSPRPRASTSGASRGPGRA